MKHLGVVFLTITSLTAAEPVNPQGEWHGALKPAPHVELRLRLDVKSTSDGKVTADLYSIDQGSPAIPASAGTLQGDKIKLEFPSIQGSYEAQVSADGKSLSGTWSQGGNSLPLSLSKGPIPADTASQTAVPLLGSWEGTMEASSRKMRVRLNINKDDKGNVTGTVDSLDQNVMGMVASGFTLKGSTFHFNVRSVGGSYDGVVDEKQSSIKGIWKQGDGGLPLEWKRVQ